MISFFVWWVFSPISLILSRGWEGPGVSVSLTCLQMTWPSSGDIWDHHHTDPLIGHYHHAFLLADTRLYWDGNGLSNLAKLNTILILTRMMIFRLLLSGELSRGRDNYTESQSLSNEGLSLVRSSWCLPLIGRHPLIILTPIMWPPYSHLVTTQTGFTSDKIIPQHFPCLVIILPDT